MKSNFGCEQGSVRTTVADGWCRRHLRHGSRRRSLAEKKFIPKVACSSFVTTKAQGKRLSGRRATHRAHVPYVAIGVQIV